MTPQKQTQFGDVLGNCFEACVATILDLPLSSLPLNKGWGNKYRMISLVRQLEKHGVSLAVFHHENFVANGEEPYIVCGSTPRGTQHCWVFRQGQQIFDPSPIPIQLQTPHICVNILTAKSP